MFLAVAPEFNCSYIEQYLTAIARTCISIMITGQDSSTHPQPPSDVVPFLLSSCLFDWKEQVVLGWMGLTVVESPRHLHLVGLILGGVVQFLQQVLAVAGCWVGFVLGGFCVGQGDVGVSLEGPKVLSPGGRCGGTTGLERGQVLGRFGDGWEDVGC